MKVGDKVIIWKFFTKYNTSPQDYSGEVGTIFGKRNDLYYVRFETICSKSNVELQFKEDEVELVNE